MLQPKMLALLVILSMAPAIVALAGAQSANIHSFYVITERGNSFPIEPPPPPLPPGFDISPYLERHTADGLVAVIYPLYHHLEWQYAVLEMGSRVDLPPIGDGIVGNRPVATVALIDQDDWDDATPFELTTSPLAGHVRVTDDRLIYGLMEPRYGQDGLFDGNWCDGTENTHCLNLSPIGTSECGPRSDPADYQCEYLESSATSNGWQYLDVSADGATIIELRDMPVGINFMCPECDPNQIYAYAGRQVTPGLWSAETTRYGDSITFSDIDSNAPPSFPRPELHPNLADVSTAAASATNSIIALDVTEVLGSSPFCQFTTGDDINVTPAERRSL